MNKGWKIAYYISTVLLSAAFIFGGIDELRKSPASLALMAHLGYPAYLLSILGVAKLLAVIGVWQKKWPNLREWAYAGIFIDLTGAFVSTLAVGDGLVMTLPVIGFAAITLVSYIGLKRRFRA